jgi:hypothetical protein
MAIALSRDKLNQMFIILMAIFSAIYWMAFVSLLVFHLIHISVMVVFMSVWVIIGFSWMTLDVLIEREPDGRFHISRVRRD